LAYTDERKIMNILTTIHHYHIIVPNVAKEKIANVS
jgi:hypothetical protein